MTAGEMITRDERRSAAFAFVLDLMYEATLAATDTLPVMMLAFATLFVPRF